jgi:hypothetical protein
MIAKAFRSVGLAALIPALLLLSPTPAAAALEFHCVDVSRYKNLLQIFHDDPATLFSYSTFRGAHCPPPTPAGRCC